MTSSQQARDAWSGVAAGYDEFVTPLVAPLAEQALDRIDLTPGDRMLDVAAGTGALSLAAARRGADVVATDIAPAMIERLKARAEREGVSVDARVMDALALEPADDTFDVAASNLGVNVIPEFRQALDEMVRVTKPGGRLLIVALGPPQKAEFFGFFLAALKATVPGFAGPPDGPPPPQFQLADPTTFEQRLKEAGLTDITVEPITYGLAFPTVDHLWGMVLNSNPMGRTLVAALSDEQTADVRDVLAGMVRERSNGNGAVLNLDVNIGIARK